MLKLIQVDVHKNKLSVSSSTLEPRVTNESETNVDTDLPETPADGNLTSPDTTEPPKEDETKDAIKTESEENESETQEEMSSEGGEVSSTHTNTTSDHHNSGKGNKQSKTNTAR